MRRKAVLMLALMVMGSLINETFARGVVGVRVIVDPWLVPVVIGNPRPILRPGPPIEPKGFINLDVRPADAAVYLDERLMGIASKIGYLKVDPGSYTVSIRKEGFKAEAFEVHVHPDRTIQLDVTLRPLPPVLPAPPVSVVVQKDAPPPPAPPAPIEEVKYKIDLEKTGFLTLQVKPADASVYIGDKYVGIASRFDDADSSIVLRAGPHRVHIMRPGFKPYATTVEIPSGGSHSLSVVLERE